MNCVIDLEGINGNANVTAIPYIDRFFGRRFRRQGFLTVKDVIMFFHNKTQDEAKNQLTRLLQNPRRNTCLANRYHVADFNVCGYAIAYRPPLGYQNPYRETRKAPGEIQQIKVLISVEGAHGTETNNTTHWLGTLRV